MNESCKCGGGCGLNDTALCLNLTRQERFVIDHMRAARAAGPKWMLVIRGENDCVLVHEADRPAYCDARRTD